ncbi:copper amine oxidase N-terminal domain-containing protein [Acetivibrio clariflavus]|uniref:Copper amine oxidase family protein n=1 Tax=Acetivibrio clariflavus (strain DSM 19732 / NBRC 101661 / EBR45) TaxID=720554 RepID=G8LVR9_ACECE|nr:copper amine oxidase N-terminal domain-containing protein [Acetivibrio clariflavus]AEV69705.1 copper amine oxidase family protein [Acetivibrio clariflavus DSM 19732]
MKKLLCGFIIGGLVFGLGNSFASTIVKNITAHYGVNKIIINGKETVSPDEDPFISNGRTYVPLRYISENMGYRVKWDDENKNVYIVEESAKEKYVLALFDEMLVNFNKAAANEKKIVDILKDEEWSWKKFYTIEGGMSILRFEDESVDFRKASRDLMDWFVNDCKEADIQSKIRIIAESDLQTDGAATEMYYSYIWELFDKHPVDFIKVLADSSKVSEEIYEVVAYGEELTYDYSDELVNKRLEVLKDLYNNDLSEKEREVVNKLIGILLIDNF